MKMIVTLGLGIGLAALSLGLAAARSAAPEFASDVISTSAGDLEITFLAHGTLMMTIQGKVIHIDPVAQGDVDYRALPKADLVLITHEHSDHLDPAAIKLVKTDETEILCSGKCTAEFPAALVMRNGDVQTALGIRIEAVPAYNVKHHRSPGVPFHPKGEGNGYVLTFGDKRVYIAGDTENVPEIKALPDIDVAFLPMNLPYTMTPEMVADVARALRPVIVYPYHYGDTDPSRLTELLKDEKDIEVRIRDLR